MSARWMDGGEQGPVQGTGEWEVPSIPRRRARRSSKPARPSRAWAMPAAPATEPERAPNVIVGAWFEDGDAA